MRKKVLLTSVCSAVLALGLSSGAWAQQEGPNTLAEDQQNTSWPEEMADPDPHKTINHVVSAGQHPYDNEDIGAIRSNDITNSNDLIEGISVDQQNNGSENAIGHTTTLHVNAGGEDDLEQDLGIMQTVFDSNIDEIFENSDGVRDNLITGSFDGMKGIATAQQNNGDGNAMAVGNVVNANIGDGDQDHTVNADQELLIRQIVRDVDVQDDTSGLSIPRSDRDNTVTNSFNPNGQTPAQGIANVQQNNGSGNAMAIGNAVSANIGAADNSHVDTNQEVRVSALVQDNDAQDENQVDGGVITGQRTNTVTNSFKGFLGVANVQQNNGSGNAIGAGTALVVDINTRPDDEPSPSDDVDSLLVKSDSIVQRNSSDSTSEPGPPNPGGYDRSNQLVNQSFNGAQGIANVQQNNGDNNALGIANGIRASLNADDIDGGQPNGTGIRVHAIGVVRQNPEVHTGINADIAQNRENDVNNSVNGASGLINVQQNNGDQNSMNVANGVAVSFDEDGTNRDQAGNGADVAAQATASVTQNSSLTSFTVDRDNDITNSFNNGSRGLANVQQNNGDQNVINSANAVFAVFDSDDTDGINGNVVSAAALSATVTGNFTAVLPTLVAPGYTNSVTNSFNGYQGIKVVQQNNGNHNAIQSAISVVANVDVD